MMEATTRTPATALDLYAHIQRQLTTNIPAQDLWSYALSLDSALGRVDDDRELDLANDGVLPLVRGDVSGGYADKTPMQLLCLLAHLDVLARNPDLAVKLIQRLNTRMHATFLPTAARTEEAPTMSTPPATLPTAATVVPAFVDLVTTLTEQAERLPLKEALSGAESLIVAMQHANLQAQADAQFPAVSEMTFELGQSNTASLRALGTVLDVYSIHASGVGGVVAAGVFADLCKALAE